MVTKSTESVVQRPVLNPGSVLYYLGDLGQRFNLCNSVSLSVKWGQYTGCITGLLGSTEKLGVKG